METNVVLEWVESLVHEPKDDLDGWRTHLYAVGKEDNRRELGWVFRKNNVWATDPSEDIVYYAVMNFPTQTEIHFSAFTFEEVKERMEREWNDFLDFLK